MRSKRDLKDQNKCGLKTMLNSQKIKKIKMFSS